MNERPRVLIEDWLPVIELGLESRRERAAIHALPPLSFLHVWWARRPLVASAAVVLAGMLPAWSEELGVSLQEYADSLSSNERRELLRPQPALTPPVAFDVPTEDWYRHWVLHLAGIWGDPQSARAKYEQAKAAGLRIPNPYPYKQAYRNGPSLTHVKALRTILQWTWGEDSPLVLDSTAGGGSIPFAAARLGIRTHANDLSPVAAAVLTAGVQAASTYGTEILDELEVWGNRLVNRVVTDVSPLYPDDDPTGVIAYVFVNTLTCPRTGRQVPLVKDWWLRKTPGQEVAAELVSSAEGRELDVPLFRLVRGERARAVAPDGVMSRGDALSPYDHLVIDGSYIKTEAQAGRLNQVLYAVAIKGSDGKRDFREVTDEDRARLEAARERLSVERAELEAADAIPVEEVPIGNKTDEPLRYGMDTWSSMFMPRQLITHAAFVRAYHDLVPEIRRAMPEDRATAVLILLALMQGKALSWNSRLSSWDVSRQNLRSVFDRHDLAFKWTFAEFDGRAVYRWALQQLLHTYGGISRLFESTGFSGAEGKGFQRDVTVSQGNAADLRLADGSVTHLCVDPPYYDNVMYAELADYFYVWEKRTLASVLPDMFGDELTDKENEAVANPARFASMGRRKKALADSDYEAKMTAIFAEAHRVLRDDGVLSVMFTHKRAEAWDTLGMALLQAGFTVETSWPVNTESEHSLHQAKVNAAASTIMLVCRKRETESDSGQVFFEDIEGEVRREARSAVERFEKAGLTGVDLLLSTYGPALSVISSAWPVYSSHAAEDGAARLLRPEEALDSARAEVVRLQRARLVGQTATLDTLSDFVLIAWDTFKAHQFPFDDARRLALAVGGLDMDELKRAKLLELKSGTARLMEPKERVRRDDGDAPGVRPGAMSFGPLIDAVHTVMYTADVDGLPAAKVLMDRLGLTKNAGFVACVQGLVNSIPRVRVEGEWTAPEAATLDRLVGAYLSDEVTLPPVLDPSESEPKRLF